MFFGRFKKPEKQEQAKPAAPVKPAAPSAIVDPDEFFKNMGRKREIPKEVAKIDTPEVTGLREKPLEAPGSTIKNLGEINTDNLIDKTLVEDDFVKGDINVINEELIDLDNFVLKEDPNKPKAPVRVEAPKPIDPEDFFKNMGRRRETPKEVVNIAVPEVTGLREKPAEAPVSTLGSINDEINTDGLADKNLLPDVFTHGDIRTIDESKIDISSLRAEEM